MVQKLINDKDIQAYVDGELSGQDKKDVQNHINRYAFAKKRYEELLEQKAMLQAWWADTHGSE